jgi:dipeptidyl aminopeptidase/acylaminoacyl peptidase
MEIRMKNIEIRDILTYQYPENLTANPSGTVTAYQVAHADEAKNDYRRDVWIIRAGKNGQLKSKQLTSTLDASIAFWEDDDHLVLNRKNPDAEKGMTDLFIIDINGGEAKKWITLPVGASNIKKAGKNLYYFTAGTDISEPDAYLRSARDRKKAEEEKKKNHDSDYQVVDELPYWMNGAGFTNGKRNSLFRMQTNPLKLQRITTPEYDVYGIDLKGDKLYIQGTKRNNNVSVYSDIQLLDTKKDKLTTLYPEKDYGFSGVIPTDDKVYAFGSDYIKYGVNESSYLYEVKNKKLEKINGYKPEFSPYNSMVGDTMVGGGKENKTVVEDGRNIYYTLMTVEDHIQLVRFDIDNNAEKTVIFDQPGNMYFFDIAGDKIIYAYADKTSLTEIYSMNRDGSGIKRITDHNTKALRGYYVAEPNRIDYEFCGHKLHGWVLLPEGYEKNKKYPAVLDVHGGPRCVYGELFFHEMQVWVARGYVVMYTNIKGSDGRGDDFADIRGDYGGTDYKNLMEFTDVVLKAYPNIDKKRICETGGSYGGFMTNWIVTQTDRFCACATQRSISNWISMSLISDIGPYFGPDQCGARNLFGTDASPARDFFEQENIDRLWDHSPLKYAKNVKTPLLFIHSDEDYRCPLPEGMQFMQALTFNGVETRMVIFHGENHELSRSGKPVHRIKRLTEITEWFLKHTQK